jgi:dihydrofolate synthase/folylpolyglutamate synthase
MPGRNRPRSDAVLDRLTRLHPKLIDLSLDRTERLLAAVGNPERALPPVVHVAGTNGKGSTVAFMRAIAEAAGLRVHVYTSPHLVRFHERIALHGKPIDEAALLAVLEECEAANAGAPVTFFEITTVAAFLAFSRTPADLLLLETGLGGRFDSTNVIARPAATAITPISIDHVQFLGDTLAKIAFEKAGILKPGAPCAVGPQRDDALAVIENRASEIGAPLSVFGRDWDARPAGSGMEFSCAAGTLALPLPALPGPHQIVNAGTAIEALRLWRPGAFGPEEVAAGLRAATWPARLQRLTRGPLVETLPAGWEVWVDGGHNPGAGVVLADAIRGWRAAGPTVLVCAMQENKDVDGFLAPLASAADRLIAIPLPGTSPGHAPEEIAAAARRAGLAAETAAGPEVAVSEAVRSATASPMPAGRVLFCGSLYLAGEILTDNG